MSSSGFVPKSVFAIKVRHIGFSYYVCSHFTNPSLLISQPSVHPLLVPRPQGFPGRSVGASLWRCALSTPHLSLLARQSPYLLVTGSSKSACLADPAFSRSPEHRRRNILKLPPWPHLSGFKHKSARRPATSALSPFSYLFHIYVTKMKSKSSPASGVFQSVTKKTIFLGLLNVSNLANSVRKAPADCFSKLLSPCLLLSLSSTHFSHISHKPRFCFSLFVFLFSLGFHSFSFQ